MTARGKDVLPHDSLRQVFANEEIERIVIIDDAFDPPVLAELDPDAATEFFNAVDNSPEARVELASHGIELTDPSDLTNEHVHILYRARNSLSALQPAWERLAGTRVRDKQEEVEPLRSRLQTELAVSVECLGVNEALGSTPAPAPIIFIDYLLDATAGGALAQRVVVHLLAQYRQGGTPPPIVVLISNTKPSADAIENFRKATDVIGGMFCFIPKLALRDARQLQLRLTALVKSLPNGRKLQAFVDTFAQSLIAAQIDFLNRVKALTLEDYAYIQALALQADGHPLGDYLGWLFSASLGDSVFSQPTMSEQQKLIDTLRFDSFPPTQQGPSHALVSMYHSATVVRVDDVTTHPRDARGLEGPQDEVYVHMGDILRRPGSSDVWALITGECDLAFAPEIKGGRKFPKNRSAVLVPGRLLKLQSPVPKNEQAKVRTELFSDGAETYRIIWDVKRTRAFPLGSLRKWLDDEGLKREYRLRMPFALEVQRAFAADLTRIGMPIPPPFYQPVRVQLFSENGDGQIEQLTGIVDNEVMLFVLRDHEMCVLSDEFVQRIVESINTATARLQQRREKLAAESAPRADDASRIGEIDKHIRQLNELQENTSSMVALQGPHRIEKDLGGAAKSATLCVTHAAATSGPYRFLQPLVLYITEVTDDAPPSNDNAQRGPGVGDSSQEVQNTGPRREE